MPGTSKEHVKSTTARLAVIVWVIAAVAAGALAWRVYGPSLMAGSDATTQAAGGNRGGGQAQPAPVATELAKTQPFVIRRRTTGTLESPAIVTVRSRIDSQLLEQHVKDGQFVEKGQLLFTLDDREVRAEIARDEATLAKDKAVVVQAESDLKRKQVLANRNLTSEAEREAAIATLEAARQTVEADEAVLAASRLRLDYARIEAPIDGRLGAITVTPGNLVQTSDSNGLVTITQIQPLRVNFALPESDVTALRAAATKNPPAPVRIFTGDEAPAAIAQLDFVDNSVDRESGTITTKATFANQDLALWPGQFVDVEIDLGSVPNTILLPSTAILMGQQGPYVFIGEDDQTAQMRNVRLGGTEGNRTAVLDGIQEGERIVIEGQNRLSEGSRWVEAETDKIASEPRLSDAAAQPEQPRTMAQ